MLAAPGSLTVKAQSFMNDRGASPPRNSSLVDPTPAFVAPLDCFSSFFGFNTEAEETNAVVVSSDAVTHQTVIPDGTVTAEPMRQEDFDTFITVNTNPIRVAHYICPVQLYYVLLPYKNIHTIVLIISTFLL